MIATRWFCLLLWLIMPVAQNESGEVIVTWQDSGNLYSWRETDPVPHQIATNKISRMKLSPDGQQVAFLRGIYGQGESLWLVNIDGTSEQVLITGDDLSGERPIIDQFEWFDNETLYFNTGQLLPEGNYQADNNLYRLNLNPNELRLILPPNAGGRFVFSPARNYIAVVAYDFIQDEHSGYILFSDPMGKQLHPVIAITESDFGQILYPPLHWNEDSTALQTALFSAGSTQLWYLPIDGTASQVGQIDADVFRRGYPTWSDVSDDLLYLPFDTADRQLELILAEGDGANPMAYVQYESPKIRLWDWLNGRDQFVYVTGTSVPDYWLGERGQEPRRIPNDTETISAPGLFGDVIVFLNHPPHDSELRFIRTDNIGTPSTHIATVDSGLFYDAIIIYKRRS